ncbi:protoplast secreted protein 2 precursor [Coemansia reversa NRRL 1564]|uniref:Protoplast secreted protein 2 n=1 Tax=Coemansia reversa (strain ATCC 12441 / NRRL 1564) TaxID=763665 RepID=A0A2G5BJV1_COERN|nr:protoplast secreted protein 2 precursor [Coemansia reversa NRRL 1564]|eukprot:PIA19279.1 protoplast secreted protein 2 precursor [Coemansia reversa NRRL 1564]
MVKVFVITYSTYGHVNTVAESVVKGLEKGGVEVGRYQIAETLSDEILTKMHAPPKADIPIIDPKNLPEADGFLFGFPTRYGTTPAQVKTFFDATGSLWTKQALAGKPAGFFFSTASQHGGQEVTVFTSLPILAHHGIIYVPFGYAHPHLFDNSEVVGGSAWGAGTVANGDGSRQPTQKELEIAEAQGENFASVAKKLAA